MRLFIASKVDEGVARRIDAGLRSIRSRVSRASWVSPDAYHLTYAFLGEQEATVVDRLRESMAELRVRRYSGVLSGGGFFPNSRRPRVGWVSPEDPERLQAIAGAVRRMLDDMAVAYDSKPFRPHLTLVRIKQRWVKRDVDEFLRVVERLGRIEACIDRVALFRSELSTTGARHTELVTAQLGA